MIFTAPQPFTEAVQKLGARSPIGAKLKSAEWARVPLALRERAFFSATIEDVRFLQDTRDLLSDFLTGAREQITLPDGTQTTALKTGSRAQFVQQAREFAVARGLDQLVPEEHRGGLRDITSQQRLELIFDTQTLAAQSYGDWQQGMDPDVLDEFPAWRFIREAEVQTPRIPHQLNEGVVRLKTDLEFWRSMNDPDFGGFGVPWGPWGFHSGMGVEDVDRAEAEALGLLQPGQPVTPVEKQFNDDLKASVRGLDPDILGLLRSSFGDQVEITGDEVRWRPAAPGLGGASYTSPPAAPRP